MKKYRHALVLILTLAVMTGLLAWSFKGVKVDELTEAFGKARWGFLPLAVLIGLCVFPIKAYRWRIILQEKAKPSFRAMMAAIMIGFMMNSIFSRIGEVVRAVILGLKKETSTSVAFASIALERIFDLLTVGLFLVVSLLWLNPTASGESASALASLRTAGLLMSVLFVVGVSVLAMLRLKPKETTALAMLCIRWMPEGLRTRLEHFLQSFLDGLNGLTSLRQVAALAGLSIVHWLVQVLFFYCVGLCLPELGLTFPGAMLIFVVTALGVGALPTPGYVGVYHAAITKIAAHILLFSEAAAVNYSWLAWLANIPPIVIIGLVWMWMEGLTLGQLRHKAEDQEPS